jgi:hypothetical protein
VAGLSLNRRLNQLNKFLEKSILCANKYQISEETMKKIILTLCALISIALVAGCSSTSGKYNEFLKSHDYNSDGEISRDEYNSSFDTIDYNGDEVLDNDEAGSVLSGH